MAGGLPLLLQDRVASYIYGPGGQILEQVQGTSAYYYHADQLGSVRALTDQSKAVVATYSYDAYGQPLTSTGSVANPFRYAGQYRDAESGLYYLRARYYDPATQQFLTVDLLLAATEQAYAYAAGSPLNATDPSGLAWASEDFGNSPLLGPNLAPPVPGFFCGVLGFCSDAERYGLWYYAEQTRLAEAMVPPQGSGPASPYMGGLDGVLGAHVLGVGAMCAPEGGGGGGGRTGVPLRALQVAEYADANGGAPLGGYVGNRPWANDGRGGGQLLPHAASDGKPITYTEYDVNPYRSGVNRGSERVVLGSDGSGYYTNDHYLNFIRFR